MKGNKIIATLVVLAMVLSTMVVLNQLNIVKEASAATPGFDEWGYATKELKYGVAYTSVTINTSTWTITNGTHYYLYYPTYLNTGAGPNADTFTWDGPFKVGVSAYVDTKSKSEQLEPSGTAITFNRSGMWIFDVDTDHSSYAGYIWVNASNEYTIDSIADIKYGASGSLTVTVNTGSDTGCMISIIRPDNSTMYHKWRSTGMTEAIKIEPENFTLAGDYIVKAYRDFDLQDDMYLYSDAGGVAYNDSYGWNITAIGYTYATIGPWDPPEKCADDEKFTVSTGKPNIILSNTTFFWGFEARIDINVTDNDGAGIDTFPTNPIVLKFGSKYIDFSTYISNEGNGNYSIQIPRFDAGNGWHDLATALGNNNVNGTWRVYFGYDDNADDVYEWNNSATFIVKSASPPVQIIMVDDGVGAPTDKKVDVPEYIAGGVAPTITMEFDIYGTSISNEDGRAYYGDDLPAENADNITISGDILYRADAVYTGPNGRWTADVTPTKPGGTITVTIDWPGKHNGSASVDVEIVNGTFVTSAVDSFTVGDDYNLTITVTDMDGAAVKNAQVYLMWEDVPYEFNDTIGNNKAGNGYNGEYTFWIPPHEDDATTPASAPQNITIAARWYEGFWGYTKVIMERDHNMIVNITPTVGYAGDSVEYDIMVSLTGGGNPDDTGLSVALFNETGVYVTGIDEWYKDGDYDIEDELIILSGGTYHIAAMNDTSDSRGHNATLIITNYSVESFPSVLAWNVDEETNMTFQLTPAGNGTLTLYNMSGIPEASELGQITQIPIENGAGSLDGVNATTLGNVTYSFTPDGGADRHADGLLRVTTATAVPSPATIYNGEATLVTITITHPATGDPIEGVDVRLEAWNASLSDTILAKIPDNETTDAAGKVQFSITADASGEVPIYIENASDPDNEFVIVATARKPMTISMNPSVDEGKTFTVEAKSNGVLITDATVTFTFDGQTWPTNTGVATITAPTVATSMAYPITASAEGYVTATGAIITIVNIPKLIVAVAGEVKAGQTFTLTVADDTGSAVIGATVTFEGKTYETGAGGTVAITAPSKAGSYPVTATFPGYDTISDTITIEEGGGIPGFELLTLVAAIGVAFLLLRRRRK